MLCTSIKDLHCMAYLSYLYISCVLKTLKYYLAQNNPLFICSERMKRRLGKRSNRDSRDEPLEKKQSLSIKSRLGIHEKKVKSRLGIRREALSSEEESTVIVHTPYVDLDPTPAKGEGVLNRWEAAIKNRPKKVKEIKKSPPVSSDSSGILVLHLRQKM